MGGWQIKQNVYMTAPVGLKTRVLWLCKVEEMQIQIHKKHDSTSRFKSAGAYKAPACFQIIILRN